MMDRLSQERALVCNFVPSFDWTSEGAPSLAHLGKPVGRAKVLFVTSGGFYRRGADGPFDEDPAHTDASIRVIEWHVDPATLAIGHPHYDHAFVKADFETMVPRSGFARAVLDGRLGSVAPVFVSFVGYLPEWRRIESETAVQILNVCSEVRADAVVLAPA